MKVNWFKYSSPANFYPLIGKFVPIFFILGILFIVVGLYWGFFKTPDVLKDQKEYYRIIYVHVSSAWMGMWLYVVMVFWAILGYIFRTKLSYIAASATAVTGAIMTFLSIWTGAFWGKTSWGIWWDWDPRLSTQLILLFLYLGYIALQSAIDDTRRSDKASAILAVLGLAIVPVIYLSVNCPDPNQCASVHQESSLERIESNILIAMMVTVLGFWMYCFGTTLMRMRNIILDRERNASWLIKHISKTNESTGTGE